MDNTVLFVPGDILYIYKNYPQCEIITMVEFSNSIYFKQLDYYKFSEVEDSVNLKNQTRRSKPLWLAIRKNSPSNFIESCQLHIGDTIKMGSQELKVLEIKLDAAPVKSLFDGLYVNKLLILGEGKRSANRIK